jgi:hypothetical protein
LLCLGTAPDAGLGPRSVHASPLAPHRIGGAGGGEEVVPKITGHLCRRARAGTIGSCQHCRIGMSGDFQPWRER